MEVTRDITKDDMDTLYHLLRQISNSDDEELKMSVNGIVTHLFEGPSYKSLVGYSQFYGRRYLIPKVLHAIKTDPSLGLNQPGRFDRIVDIGCGLGWLGRGLSGHFNAQVLFIDKRDHISLQTMKEWRELHFSFEVRYTDLEIEMGLGFLKSCLKDKDLVVMCDFLHCIDDPSSLLKLLAPWPMIILEYCSPKNYPWLCSFQKQLKRYGATAYHMGQLVTIVHNATGIEPKYVALDPYLMLVVGGDI